MKKKSLNQKTNKLKILKVIHGYPPYYIAGSEVYSYNLCNELSKTCDVSVFTRIEDDFRKPYEVSESNENGIEIIRINKPGRDYTFRSKYIDKRMARIFEDYIQKINPDIVHIGHLSHLTVTIVETVKKYKIPIIFTLHDYWMMCIRGQLIRDDLIPCNGPGTEKCTTCNSKYFLSYEEAKKEIELWLDEISRINNQVDLFIAPSLFLRKKYIEYGIPANKIKYLDYGFNKEYFKDFKKKPSNKIRFGFLGRIIPVKGITTLIDAFNGIDHFKAILNIFGKLPNSSHYLKNRCENSAIRFKGSFKNQDISKVLSEIDVLIVPSVWYENSPLVIHEAFLANIPVITSNLGGMAELVKHEKNGLLFKPGDVLDLHEKINKFIENPNLMEKLTQIITPVRSIEQDAQEIIELYYRLLNKQEVELIACEI